MPRNAFGNEPAETRAAVLRSTRGREMQLSGPANEDSSGSIGTVREDGRVALYGLLDITPFDNEGWALG